MTKLAKGVIVSTIILLVILIISCIVSKTNRQAEVDESLNTAIHQTMKVLADERYKIKSNDELLAEFHNNLLSKISSNSNVEVIVYDVDYERGLLDVEVQEDFKYPHGVGGTVSSRKTVVIDETENQ